MIPKTLADALGVFGSRETDGAGTGVVSEGVAAVTVAAEAAPNDEAAGSETEAKNSEASELAEVTASSERDTTVAGVDTGSTGVAWAEAAMVEPETLADTLGSFATRETDGARTGVVSEGVAAVTIAAEVTTCTPADDEVTG
jgi:hypothetical protein